jgi:predicted glycoside hydrolase/deacetylase ChbG (UPF0249 family)
VKQLIVNADDFNLTRGVSRGILEAHTRGIVTSTTVMINLPPDEVLFAELARSSLGIGLHVNLTLGRPVTPAAELPSLVDAEGRFFRDAQWVATRAKPEEVEREIAAQYNAFLKRFGTPPTHLDSHHHCAFSPPLREVFFGFARSVKLPIRSTDSAIRAEATRKGLKTPDCFFGESGPEPYWTEARAVERIRRLPDGVSEFMCHPGYFDESLAYSRYGQQREVELEGLTAPAVREAVPASGVTLCHFGALR